MGAIAFTSPADLTEIVTENEKQKIRWKSFEKLPKEVKLAVAAIKNTPSGINIETIDRLKAIEMLLKYLGINESEVKKVVIMGEDELDE